MPPGQTSANLRITFSGLLCVAVLVLVGLAALNGEANLLFLLCGVAVGVMVFSAVAPVLMVRKIAVERTVPEAAVAGRPFTVSYVVRNRRGWARAWCLVISETPSGVNGAAFPQGFVPVLAPGQEQRIDLVARCASRGRLTLRGIRVRSRFPFGLFSCAVDLESPAELTVWPTVGAFRRDPFKDSRYARSPSARGGFEHPGQDEFYGVREYREGDNYRWIHWRRSARTGQLVIREMMPLRQTQLIVMVDAWPGEAAGASGRSVDGASDIAAERVISAAATAICDGLERGHRVGLICRSAIPLVLAPAGGRPHRQRLLQELASMEPGAGEGLDQLVSRVRWSTGWHARCMICATRLDATHDRVARLLGGRVEATVVLSPQSEGFDALFDGANEPAVHGRRL